LEVIVRIPVTVDLCIDDADEYLDRLVIARIREIKSINIELMNQVEDAREGCEKDISALERVEAMIITR
jgi:hypothetical protein